GEMGTRSPAAAGAGLSARAARPAHARRRVRLAAAVGQLARSRQQDAAVDRAAPGPAAVARAAARTPRPGDAARAGAGLVRDPAEARRLLPDRPPDAEPSAAEPTGGGIERTRRLRARDVRLVRGDATTGGAAEPAAVPAARGRQMESRAMAGG